MSDQEMRRGGYFTLSDYLYTELGDDGLEEMFAALRFVPLRVEHLAYGAEFTMVGLSHLFEPVDRHGLAPKYELLIELNEDTGKLEFKGVKPTGEVYYR